MAHAGQGMQGVGCEQGRNILEHEWLRIRIG
jgi:hypothetical protein